MAAEVNEQLLDERLAELEKARAWSPRLVSKLESHIRSADEEGLFRVNPFTFAREKNLKETEIIDLFLYAVRFENGFIPRIEFYAIDHARSHAVHKLDRAEIFLFAVDADGREIVG